MHILVFGDSITYGAWDEKGGWVQRLREYIDRKNLHDKGFYCLVYNLGISGDTTKDVISRFENETKARLEDEKDIIFIFSVGTNDCLLINKEKKMQVEEKQFERNIEKLADSASKLSNKIFFTGLTPIDETKMNPLQWAPQFSAKNNYIEKYDGIIKSVCKKKNIHFIEVYGNFKKAKYKSLLKDGDHPTSEGHDIIFRTVKDYLSKGKII